MPFLVSSVLAAAAARPVSAADVRNELEAEYRRYITSYKNRDFSTMEKMLASDLKWKQLGATTLNRAQSLAYMKRQRAAVKSLKALTARIDRITPKGPLYIVQTTSRFVGSITGDDGRPHSVDMTGIARDTWLKTPNGWRVKLIEDLYQTGKFDNQPVTIGRKPR